MFQITVKLTRKPSCKTDGITKMANLFSQIYQKLGTTKIVNKDWHFPRWCCKLCLRLLSSTSQPVRQIERGWLLPLRCTVPAHLSVVHFRKTVSMHRNLGSALQLHAQRRNPVSSGSKFAISSHKVITRLAEQEHRSKIIIIKYLKIKITWLKKIILKPSGFLLNKSQLFWVFYNLCWNMSACFL